MKIEEIIERIEDVSYDGCTPKSDFIKILNEFPEFKEELEKELASVEKNQEWLEKATHEKFYFNITNSSWKRNKSSFPNSIRLTFLTQDRIPTVSISINQKRAWS